MPLFEAYCYHANSAGSETASQILYEADDVVAAVADAVRWYGNRHAAWPEAFPKLWCLKVYSFAPKRVQPDGYLMSPRVGFCLFEWKHDWPGTFEQHLQSWEERRAKSADA